jgi:hypothetical protein
MNEKVSYANTVRENANVALQETAGFISRRKFALGLGAMIAGVTDVAVTSSHDQRISEAAQTQVRDQLGNTKPYNEVKRAMDDAGRKAVEEDGQPGALRGVAEGVGLFGGAGLLLGWALEG